jgi:uncharacterized protein
MERAWVLPSAAPLRRPRVLGGQALGPRRGSVSHSQCQWQPSRMSLDPTDLADVPVERSPEPKRPLDELVDFPCVFTFKVVGLNEGDFLDDICVSVAGALKTATQHLKTSFRDRGKYRSITLRAPVNNAKQIYDVYAAIDEVRCT